MMNILQVTKGALMGGGERHVLTLLEGFKDQDVRVSLAVFTEGRLAKTARRMGIDVHVLPKKFRGDLRPLKQLVDLIKIKKIDIVHTHLISGNLYGRLAGKIAGIKGIVSTLHHSRKDAIGHFSLPFMQDLFFLGDNLMAQISDRIITPSEDLKCLMSNYGVKASRIVTIPNAINMDNTLLPAGEIDACRREFAVSPDMKLIGMVGRLVPVKNFELYIKAARNVIDQGIKAKFLIIGDGPLRSDLERLSAELSLDDHLIFTGFREDVFRLVAMLDLFVLCSRSETNPIALMEAMASGKPVIATDVGGVAELVDHKMDGWLCPSNEEICIADAIIHLLVQEDMAGALGNRAREKMLKYYSLKQAITRLLAVYKEIVRE